VGEWDRAQNLDTYACRGVFLHYSHGHVIMTMLFSPRGDAVKEMAAGTFKAQCLAIMDHVFQSGEPVLITKHGKPVAKLVPAENQADDIFGYMTGKVKIVGDIVGPVTPPEDWECK
ncbi:MAG: type II toxin-antitoxin system prevent-host-death family antitoxin, partial [Candidatus Sulfotelmatobacter sp.]